MKQKGLRLATVLGMIGMSAVFNRADIMLQQGSMKSDEPSSGFFLHESPEFAPPDLGIRSFEEIPVIQDTLANLGDSQQALAVWNELDHDVQFAIIRRYRGEPCTRNLLELIHPS